MDVFVINLKRRPDRWQHFVEAAGSIGLADFRRFEAIDGQILELTPEIEALFEVKRPSQFVGRRVPRHHGFNAAIIGCALSHYSIWQQLVSNPNRTEDDYVMIFEDDVVFDRDFIKKWKSIEAALVTDKKWEMIYLGFHDDRGERYGDFQVHDGVYEFNGNPDTPRRHGGGSHAYCVRKRGAGLLVNLAHTLKIQQPIDHWLIDQFDVVCAYKTVPYLVTANNCHVIQNADTDIQFTTRVLKTI